MDTIAIEYVKICDLVHPDYNPRQISKFDREHLKQSLSEFGAVDPAVINKHPGRENIIVGGNQRVMVAGDDLNWDAFPCVFVDLDLNRERELNVRLNNNTGEWDWDKLRVEFAFDELLDWGFENLPESVTAPVGLDDKDEDSTPEVSQSDPVVKPGDLWNLGTHKLICGDSTDALVVNKLLDGGCKPHLMVTDPPYGVEYDATWREEAGIRTGAVGKVANDDRANWAEAWALFEGDVAYVWHASTKAYEVLQSLIDNDFDIRAQIVWVKNGACISRGHYHFKHESCLYAVKKGRTGHWGGDRKQSTVWEIDKPMKSETGHSTQKPVECMERPIQNNSKPGDFVYEPFCGSGTTIIACEKTGRKCRAIELEPKYCDVIINRWCEYTGKDAIRDDGVKWSDLHAVA